MAVGILQPREVVVDHGDGTVSPLMEAKFLDVVDGIVRARRKGDVLRLVRQLTPVLDKIVALNGPQHRARS